VHACFLLPGYHVGVNWTLCVAFAALSTERLHMKACSARFLPVEMTVMFLTEQEAVEKDKVENMTITVGTQRRAVLEAIAFGAFLRDVETHVDQV